MSETNVVNPSDQRERVERVVIREWWRRVSFAIRFGVNGVQGDELGKDWFFNYEIILDRRHKGRKVFWPRAWVQIFGVNIGAGLYLDYDV